MPTALEKLIKILKLEKKNGFDNQAVMGGLQAFAPNWADEARQQVQRPEQYALIEELLLVMADYQSSQNATERQKLALYMFERITQRTKPTEKYKVEPPKELPNMPPREKRSYENREQSSQPRQENRERRGQKGRQMSLPEEEPQYHPPSTEILPKPRRKKQPMMPLSEAEEVLRTLNKPLTALRGVGEKMAEKLQRIGPQTLGELLYLFPRRYDDYTRLLPLNKLKPYETYTLVATITAVNHRKGKNNRDILSLTIEDGTGRMEVTFFNQIWLKRQLKVGMQLVFSGKTDLFLGKLVLNNPAWEPVEQKNLHTGGIVPVYPLTKGVSGHTMRRLMHTLVTEWASKIPDSVPISVLDRANQVDLGWALQQIHFPQRWEFLDYARERLAFDQLLVLQLGIMANRTEWQANPAHPLPVSDEWLNAFIHALPFQLTGAQTRAVEAIRADMTQGIPMNRLLQGDVGSGKTMVALAQMAIAAVHGKQAVLMAPTSILAEQHYQKISALAQEMPGLEEKRVALLTSALTPSVRRETYAGLAEGSIDLLIGTHAVIQEGVEFHDLAAVVIDEQHRFGVEQRGALRGKGINPHVLVMTATPIPRTLSLTIYADLDLTVMDELPPGRTPIQTRIVDSAQRKRVYEFVEDRVLQAGQQLYVIYPLIETSESVEAESALDGYEYIRKVIYPHYKVGLIHGRMKAAEKDAVMAAFASGETQILVSTSVIEVGVDVPNATAIIIENAERFGLAQLHQLRGRVGRGEHKSYCLLLSDEAESPRLKALEETTDGFKLAEKDWEQRGAGDLLGVRQSGTGDKLLLAEFMTVQLVEVAQQESKALYAEDPDLAQPEHHLLARRVKARRDDRSDLT